MVASLRLCIVVRCRVVMRTGVKRMKFKMKDRNRKIASLIIYNSFSFFISVCPHWLEFSRVWFFHGRGSKVLRPFAAFATSAGDDPQPIMDQHL